MIFDTHAHYDDDAFDIDREELLASMEAGGIGTIVNSCASIDGLDNTIALMEKYRLFTERWAFIRTMQER